MTLWPPRGMRLATESARQLANFLDLGGSRDRLDQSLEPRRVLPRTKARQQFKAGRPELALQGLGNRFQQTFIDTFLFRRSLHTAQVRHTLAPLVTMHLAAELVLQPRLCQFSICPRPRWPDLDKAE